MATSGDDRIGEARTRRHDDLLEQRDRQRRHRDLLVVVAPLALELLELRDGARELLFDLQHLAELRGVGREQTCGDA